jgi:hypothetical protein
MPSDTNAQWGGSRTLHAAAPRSSRPSTRRFEYRPGNWASTRFAALAFLPALILPLLVFILPASGQTPSDPQRQPLGSLDSTGEVFVNEQRAPSELTVFPGDTLRTGETGTARLTAGGNSSVQVSHDSQVVFSGDPHYVAELKAGAITFKSLGGAGGAVVRAGNYVVVPASRTESSTVTIESAADGSFLVTCSAGSAEIVPLQEGSGILLQTGLSARISSKGELTAATPTGTHPAGKNRLLLYLGLAGAGAAAGTAAAIAHGGSHPPVSPVSP